MRSGKSAALLVGIFLVVIGWAGQSSAGVNVNVGVFAPPPAYVVPAPPPMVVIPGSYVYVAPGLDVDILFYHGYWWRPYDGRWYRARHYNGPWGYMSGERVPRAIIALPPDYRSVPPGHERIPYGQMKKNWGRWEKERHWDRHDNRHDDRRQDRHEDRRERGDRGEHRGHGDRGDGHGRGDRHGDDR